MPTVRESYRPKSYSSSAERALAVSGEPAVAWPEEGYGDVDESATSSNTQSNGLRSQRARRRYLRRAVLALVILLALAPISLWLRYQALHVTSTNALVRAYVAEIGTRLDGVVKSVEVDAGDRVIEGQVLVRLEDRHLRAEAQEAKAEIMRLERAIEVEKLALVHERRRMEQQLREAIANVAAAEAQTKAAEIRALDARQDHAARQSLFGRGGAVSSEDVRSAEATWRTAEALSREARAKYQAAQSAEENVRVMGDALAVREREIGLLEAELLRAQAKLLRTEADLEGASIRAPENGAIVRRIVQPGGSVDVGQPIISMWLGQDVWIEAWVDEEDIAAVKVGNEATVTMQSFPGRELTGVVDKIGLATDFEMPASEVPQPRHSRMRGLPVVGVRIRLLEPPAELLPGLSAVAAIRKSEG